MIDTRPLIKRLSDALLAVRPLGGSEMFIKAWDGFHVADPDYCTTLIKEMQAQNHELKKAEVLNGREIKRLREALRHVQLTAAADGLEEWEKFCSDALEQKASSDE